MEMLLDILTDAVIDTLKLVPFLFLTYLVMELIEAATSDKVEQWVAKSRKAGPIVGALVGIFPQCGFSTAAATLYAGRVITLGTLIAVFLATSDEMIPIFIAEQVDPLIIAKILGAKLIIGLAMGLCIDAAARVISDKTDKRLHIHELCEREHCECEDGPLKSAVHHTVSVSLFIFVVSFLLTGAMELVGEEALASVLASNSALAVIVAGLVGLIPNCAASVIIVELFLEGVLSTGAMMSGLLVGAGVGLLVLFRSNRPLRNNLIITSVLFIIGVAWGFIFELVGIVF